MGAALLSARAIMRVGTGLVTCHVPRCGYQILQLGFPEAMCKVDTHRYVNTQVADLSPYQAIGIGPGLGTDSMTAALLRDLLQRATVPLVLDADALNLLAADRSLFDLVPPGSILTPHPGEFRRLFKDQYDPDDEGARSQVQWKFAGSRGLTVVYKTGQTLIADPAGRLYRNTTGNPGMATAGTGDVLTGILTGLLAQGYAASDAARLGVYLHGLAGDLAAESTGQEFLLAGDVITHLGMAFTRLRAGEEE